MKSKSIQIKTKLILISILSVAVFVCLIFSVAVFWINNTAQTDWYISNIVSHITYNLNNIINGAENRSLKILSNDTIQNNLRIQNDVKTSALETINSKTRIKNAIEVDTLYDQYVVSTSVISDTGVDTTVKMTLFKDMLSDVITKDEVYEANGKLLWALTEDSHRICICRAILDLESMKPLGYVGIVYEPSIMGDIIKETSSKIKCESVLLSPSGTIISCKDDSLIGTHSNDYDTVLKVLKNEKQQDPLFFYYGNRLKNGWIVYLKISFVDYYKSAIRLVATCIIFFALVLLIGMRLIKIATNNIYKPTQALLTSMKAFSENNQYQRVQVESQDEFGQIGQEYNRLVQHIEDLIEKIYKLEIEQQKAENDFLRMQINPHFLYNTLDAINWMAVSANNNDISEMVVSLAELLRASISSPMLVSLKDEIKTIESYLTIQKFRFSDKITFLIHIDQKALNCLIPNFLLQPLVENAIIHGLEPQPTAGTVEIKAYVYRKKLTVCVSDDGVGMTKEEQENLVAECTNEHSNVSLGLRNVYRRLYLLYGKESLPKIKSIKGKGTHVSFSIPEHTK